MTNPRPKKETVVRRSRDQHERENRWWWIISISVATAGAAVAFLWMEPPPPERFRLATGPDGGAYARWGEQYRQILSEDGIEVELLPTAGSQENLELLRSGHADLAFVQSGVRKSEPSSSTHPPPETSIEPTELQAIGALYVEPLWLFIPAQSADLIDIRGLFGQQIAAGEAGSGTRAIVEALFGVNGQEPEALQIISTSESPWIAHPGVGDPPVDAKGIFLVGEPTSAGVMQLFRSPDWKAVSLPRRDAYAQRFRDLTAIRVPEGLIDFVSNHPSQDLELISPAATLIMRDDFHPALVVLSAMAARKCFRPATLLTPSGVYPNESPVSFPMNEDALRFLERGPSFLNRVLPFWAANLVDRWIVFLLPFLTLLVPLVRIVPPLIRWRIRRGIKKWYLDLLSLEEDLASGTRSADETRARLKQIGSEVDKIAVPPAYGDELYQLHLHIAFVADRVGTVNPD